MVEDVQEAASTQNQQRTNWESMTHILIALLQLRLNNLRDLRGLDLANNQHRAHAMKELSESILLSIISLLLN